MSVSRVRRRWLVLAASAACAVLASLVVPAASSASIPPPSGCTFRYCIAGWAEHEWDTPAHNKEVHDGTHDNCNYYTTQWHSAATNPPRCSNGWKSQDWCADFVHYIYEKAGASVAGLSSLAADARTYGNKHGTWHSSPKVGDLALWTTNHHVGIVVGIPDSTHVTIVSGNWSNHIGWESYPRSDIAGYAGPVQ